MQICQPKIKLREFSETIDFPHVINTTQLGHEENFFSGVLKVFGSVNGQFIVVLRTLGSGEEGGLKRF